MRKSRYKDICSGKMSSVKKATPLNVIVQMVFEFFQVVLLLGQVMVTGKP